MEAEEKKTDRRVTKTKSAIREAFQSLVEEKKYSEITVKELTERADITRKTFYLHYGTLDDLLREYLAELFGNLIAEMALPNFRAARSEEQPDWNSFDYTSIYLSLSQRLERDQSKIQSLIGDETSRQIIHQVLQGQQQKLWENYQQQFGLDPEAAKLYGTFIIYGFNAMYMTWYSDQEMMPVEEFADMTRNIAACLSALPAQWGEKQEKENSSSF